MHTAFTIGHSTHTIAKFIELLKMHSITAVCDVRSKPYSRTNHQYNRESLQKELNKNDIFYAFLGRELGARTDNPNCYIDGKVQYNRIAATTLFREGIENLTEIMKDFRIAIMCAEKEPLACHRTILVARHLQDEGVEIKHILANGKLETREAVELRLLRQLNLAEEDLFKTLKERIAQAYQIQGERIAYMEQVEGNRPI